VPDFIFIINVNKAARMGEMRDEYNILVGRPEGRTTRKT
jgi:hypothetical protein